MTPPPREIAQRWRPTGTTGAGELAEYALAFHGLSGFRQYGGSFARWAQM
jgi:hypothetical protein